MGMDLPTYVFAQSAALTIWFLILGLPVSWLLARFIFRQKEPDAKASYSVAIPFAIFAYAYGVGGDPDLWFSKWEGLLFAPGALLSWLFLRWQFRKRDKQSS